ncbi:MAG: hypothetical protein ACRDD8_13290 [Bacteroidales bacterium]
MVIYAVICTAHYAAYNTTDIGLKYGNPYIITIEHPAMVEPTHIKGVFKDKVRALAYTNCFPIVSPGHILYKYTNPKVVDIQELLSNLNIAY